MADKHSKHFYQRNQSAPLSSNWDFIRYDSLKYKVGQGNTIHHRMLNLQLYNVLYVWWKATYNFN